MYNHNDGFQAGHLNKDLKWDMEEGSAYFSLEKRGIYPQNNNKMNLQSDRAYTAGSY